MKVSDFDFNLPRELIAQHPAEHRELSHMMVLPRVSGDCHIEKFQNFKNYLEPGDCLILNNTRVLSARLWGHRDGSGGRVQAFLQEPIHDKVWKAMLRPGRRLLPGSKVLLNKNDNYFKVVEHLPDGCFAIEFFGPDGVYDVMEHYGCIPLPPYIDREPEEADKERYQTVYAQVPGAVAAPTAGLHFTPEILKKIEASGVTLVRITLHVGAGTFKPVKVENVEDHHMHEEKYWLTEESADIINNTHAAGHRVFCVGTTTVRVLETCADPKTRKVVAGSGKTSIFLYPPKKPVIVDGLLTNFHLPKSTLLMLVCTFAEHDRVMNAYQKAVEHQMHFFSYGDCMLLLPQDEE